MNAVSCLVNSKGECPATSFQHRIQFALKRTLFIHKIIEEALNKIENIPVLTCGDYLHILNSSLLLTMC